ncbi:MAG: FAD binding domain-containing protein, partial [Nocardioidaceae bacterium]
MMRTLHRPETLDEACGLLAELDDAQVYGGGTAIQILVKQGLLFTEDLVDLSLVPGLTEITVTDDAATVGAMVPLRRVERDPGIKQIAPLASGTYAHVANPRVRNTASVGGNLAHGDYRLDPPAALLVLDGTVTARSVRGSREIPVRKFFTEFQATALAHDEVLTEITIPAQPPGSRGMFVKQSALGANDWPAASAAALLRREGDRSLLALGLCAVAPVPMFLSLDITGMGAEYAATAAAEAAEPLMDP